MSAVGNSLLKAAAEAKRAVDVALPIVVKAHTADKRDRELDAEILAVLIGREGVTWTDRGLVIVPCSDGKNTCLIAPEITREIVKARKLMEMVDA